MHKIKCIKCIILEFLIRPFKLNYSNLNDFTQNAIFNKEIEYAFVIRMHKILNEIFLSYFSMS